MIKKCILQARTQISLLTDVVDHTGMPFSLEVLAAAEFADPERIGMSVAEVMEEYSQVVAICDCPQ